MARIDQPPQASAEELAGLLRQERADFRHYRRRVANERRADLDRMRGGLLEPLLPVLDDLDRAFAEIPERLTGDPWVRGVELTRSRLGEVQQRLGLERLGEPGESFDPTRHEAIVYEPDPHATEATLQRVIRPGYASGGWLLRPAQVVVRGPLLDGSIAPPDDRSGG
jgi:molecular chaperone GrpE